MKTLQTLMIALAAILVAATVNPQSANADCSSTVVRNGANHYWSLIKKMKRNHCASTSLSGTGTTTFRQLRAAARALQEYMRINSCNKLGVLKAPIPYQRHIVCNSSFKRTRSGPTSRPFRTTKSLKIFAKARLFAVYVDQAGLYALAYEFMAGNFLRKVPRTIRDNSAGLDDDVRAKFTATAGILNRAFGSGMIRFRRELRFAYWDSARQLRKSFAAYIRVQYRARLADKAKYDAEVAKAKAAVKLIVKHGKALVKAEKLKLKLRKQRKKARKALRTARALPNTDTTRAGKITSAQTKLRQINQKYRSNRTKIRQLKDKANTEKDKARAALVKILKAKWNFYGEEDKILAKVTKIVQGLPNNEPGKAIALQYVAKAKAEKKKGRKANPYLIVLYAEAAIRSLSPNRQRLLTGSAGPGFSRVMTKKDLKNGLVLVQGPNGAQMGVSNDGKVTDKNGNPVNTAGSNVFLADPSLIGRLSGNRYLGDLRFGISYVTAFNTNNEMKDGASLQIISALLSYQFNTGGWQLPLSIRLGFIYVTGGNPTRTKDPSNRLAPILGIEWKWGYKWSWLTFYWFTAEFDFLPWATASFGSMAFEFDIRSVKLQVQLFKWTLNTSSMVSGGTRWGNPLPDLTVNGYGLGIEARF